MSYDKAFTLNSEDGKGGIVFQKEHLNDRSKNTD